MNAYQVLSPNGAITSFHALVPAVLLHASENASSVQAASTNEDGEAYGVSSAAVVAIANVSADAVIILPMSPPLEDVEVDFTYVAASKTAFVQVRDKLQERMTCSHCLGYSAGVGERPVAVGALIKFLSHPHYAVAKPRLLAAIRASVPLGQISGPEVEFVKRQCLRQLVGVMVAGDLRTEDEDGNEGGKRRRRARRVFL